jgi:hypothetical protein
MEQTIHTDPAFTLTDEELARLLAQHDTFITTDEADEEDKEIILN